MLLDIANTYFSSYYFNILTKNWILLRHRAMSFANWCSALDSWTPVHTQVYSTVCRCTFNFWREEDNGRVQELVVASWLLSGHARRLAAGTSGTDQVVGLYVCSDICFVNEAQLWRLHRESVVGRWIVSALTAAASQTVSKQFHNDLSVNDGLVWIMFLKHLFTLRW